MENATDKKQKNIDLGSYPVGRLIARLALPAVVAQVINLLYNLVDRMYVSNIPGSGMDALAGLGVVFPITLIVSAFAYLVGMGGAPLAGIRTGEGRKEEAEKIFNNGFIMLAFFGVALTIGVTLARDGLVTLFGAPDSCFEHARDYLGMYALGTVFVMMSLGLNPFITTQGRSITSMLTVLIGAVLNIALDPLFIFAFGMGVKGAALATIISQGVSAVWVVCFFFRKSSLFRFRPAYFLPEPKRAGAILLLGLSPFIMSVTESAIQIVFNVNLKMYSGGNGDYTAAITIMLSAVQIICLPLNGLGMGVQPLISYNYGKGNFDRIKKAVRIVTLVALCYSTSMWLLSLITPQVYGYIFNASPSVAVIIKKYTPFFMAGTIMFFAQMSLQNVLVALGQAKLSIFLACLRKIILLIPLCFLLPLAFGVSGVFYSEGISDILAGITTAVTFFAMLPRIISKRKRALLEETNGKETE